MATIDRVAYTTDSPLFAKSVGEYGKEITSLKSYLGGIIEAAKEYASNIRNLAKSGESMGELMRSRSVGGSETNMRMIGTIRSVADAILDISSAQNTLASMIEQSFCAPLENICEIEIEKYLNLQKEYQATRCGNDPLVFNYLQSDAQNFGKGLDQIHLDARAYHVALHNRKFELSRFDLVTVVNKMEYFKRFNITETFADMIYSLQSTNSRCSDHLNVFSSKLNESLLTCSNEKEKELFEEKFLYLNQKRVGVVTALDSTVERIIFSVRSATSLVIVEASNQQAQAQTPEQVKGTSQAGTDSLSSNMQTPNKQKSYWYRKSSYYPTVYLPPPPP